MQVCWGLNIVTLSISFGCLNGSYAPENEKQYMHIPFSMASNTNYNRLVNTTSLTPSSGNVFNTWMKQLEHYDSKSLSISNLYLLYK